MLRCSWTGWSAGLGLGLGLGLDWLVVPTLALTPTPALTLTLLPCSWGSLFFPAPWREFHRYMRRRLHGKTVAVQIPHRRVLA